MWALPVSRKARGDPQCTASHRHLHPEMPLPLAQRAVAAAVDIAGTAPALPQYPQPVRGRTRRRANHSTRRSARQRRIADRQRPGRCATRRGPNRTYGAIARRTRRRTANTRADIGPRFGRGCVAKPAMRWYTEVLGVALGRDLSPPVRGRRLFWGPIEATRHPRLDCALADGSIGRSGPISAASGRAKARFFRPGSRPSRSSGPPGW